MADVDSLEFALGSREFDAGVTEQGNFINQFLIQNARTVDLPYSWRIKAAVSSPHTLLQANVYIYISQEKGKGILELLYHCVSKSA